MSHYGSNMGFECIFMLNFFFLYRGAAELQKSGLMSGTWLFHWKYSLLSMKLATVAGQIDRE